MPWKSGRSHEVPPEGAIRDSGPGPLRGKCGRVTLAQGKPKVSIAAGPAPAPALPQEPWLRPTLTLLSLGRGELWLVTAAACPPCQKGPRGHQNQQNIPHPQAASFCPSWGSHYPQASNSERAAAHRARGIRESLWSQGTPTGAWWLLSLERPGPSSGFPWMNTITLK
ncbi:hypothetical protein VULLAG_LOCUS9662 [Vulpes lagopus]